jgi:hypothetical protein
VSLQLFLEKRSQNKVELQGYLFALGVVVFVLLANFDREPISNYPDELREERINRVALAAIRKAPIDKYRHCVFQSKNDSWIPQSFVVAILVVENYGRPSLRRWLEELFAKSSLILIGKLPDISLGVGQVTPSVARKVLGSKLAETNRIVYTDAQILNLLLEPCENTKIIKKYLAVLMHEQGVAEFDSSAMSFALRIYNGQIKSSLKNDFYIQVVWKIFSILQARGLLSVGESSSQSPFFNKQIQDDSENSNIAIKEHINSFLEYYRRAYNNKDIAFIEKALADDAIIIVGNATDCDTMTSEKKHGTVISIEKRFACIHKKEYIERLRLIFMSNSYVLVRFEEIKVVRYQKDRNLYAATFEQYWISSNYSDKGYMFLLLDFANKSFPLIHVRLWH